MSGFNNNPPNPPLSHHFDCYGGGGGRAAGQLLANFFFLSQVTFREVVTLVNCTLFLLVSILDNSLNTSILGRMYFLERSINLIEEH